MRAFLFSIFFRNIETLIFPTFANKKTMIKNILLVGVGGALGSMLRYAVGLFSTTYFPKMGLFPLGTFLVNVIGCLFIGMLWGILATYSWLSEELRLLLMVGFCGGFTTFSSYSLDAHIVAKENIGLSIFYLGLSLTVGLLFVFAGYSLIRFLK